jgi:hypothetical protein
MTIRSLKWNRAMKGARTQIKVPPHALKRVRHQGVVATVSPLTVYLEDMTVACPAHLIQAGGTPYMPVANDCVFVDDQNGDLVVVGKYLS